MADATSVKDPARLKPQMNRRGMFHMKHVTLATGGRYENMSGGHLGQMGFLGYMYEVCNLSDGRRTLAEIRRILAHEITAVDLDTLAAMVGELEQLGYLTLKGDD